MVDWEEVKKNSSLEDIYNILYRNKPNRRSKLFDEWNYLESVIYEELLNEDEKPKKCDKLIDEAIEFLKAQKQNTITKML